MSILNETRANAHSDKSEAERIYNEEAYREAFVAIQKVKSERDAAILDAIQKINAEYAEKLNEVEAQHAFVLALSKGIHK